MDEFGPKNPHPLAGLSGEFVWKGKYDASGRRVEPSPINPPPQVDPLEWWGTDETPDHGDRTVDPLALDEADLVLEGDNLLALSALLERHRGQVQMIYIDPPFAVGRSHTMRVPVGGARKDGGNAGRGSGPADELAMVAYRDAWSDNGAGYMGMMHERLVLMRDLLRDSGVLFLHCDWRVSHHLRLLLDDLFGPERFINEIVWHYYNKYSAGRHRLARAHDTILVYGKSPGHRLNELRLPREEPRRQLVRENVGGVLRNARDDQGKLRYRTVHDRKADDVWRIPQLQPASREWTGYATQKHHDLIERIVALGSREGDLVADFFSGSGTLLSVARRMGRRWIGCDMGAQALHTTRRRLLPVGTPQSANGAARPYVVASLGRGMAGHWSGKSHNGDGAAYRRDILESFGAEPASGEGSSRGVVHGDLDGALCHVAAPEARVGTDRALSLARVAVAEGRSAVYLLAWDFDPLFWDDMTHFAPEFLQVLRPYRIPTELAGPGGGEPIFQGFPRCEWETKVEKNDSGGYRLSVGLKGVHRLPARRAGGGALQDDEGGEEGLAWVEGWALDPYWAFTMPMRPRWWSYRERRKRALRTDAGPFELPGGRGPMPFAVVLADAQGCVTRHGARLDRPVAPR